MKLKIWLLMNGLTIKDMAEDMGMWRQHLSRIANGCRPSRSVARKISAYTKGEISEEYLLSLTPYLEKYPPKIV